MPCAVRFQELGCVVSLGQRPSDRIVGLQTLLLWGGELGKLWGERCKETTNKKKKIEIRYLLLFKNILTLQ